MSSKDVLVGAVHGEEVREKGAGVQDPFYEGREHVSGQGGPAAVSHTCIALTGPQKSLKGPFSHRFPKRHLPNSIGKGPFSKTRPEMWQMPFWKTGVQQIGPFSIRGQISGLFLLTLAEVHKISKVYQEYEPAREKNQKIE